MAVRQYIGARYVIKVYENTNDPSSAEWEPNVNYEPLTLVTYNNGSYLSKKGVPANIGDPANNPTYWAQTGFYNGQIAHLQNEIDDITTIIDHRKIANVLDYGAIGDGITDDTQAFDDAIATGLTVYVPEGKYLISGVDVPRRTTIIIDGEINSSNYLFKFLGDQSYVLSSNFMAAYGEKAIIFDTTGLSDTVQFNKFTAKNVRCFGKYGVYMYSANDHGVTCNEIKIDQLCYGHLVNPPTNDVTDADAKFGYYMESDNNGFVNENTFYKSHGQNWTSVVAMFVNGTNTMNNNTFENLSPENSFHGFYLNGASSAVLGNFFKNVRNEDNPTDLFICEGRLESNHISLSEHPKAAAFTTLTGVTIGHKNIIENGMLSGSGGLLWSSNTIMGKGMDNKLAFAPVDHKLTPERKYANNDITFDIEASGGSNNHQYGIINCVNNMSGFDINLSTSFDFQLINELYIFVESTADNINVKLPVGESGGVLQYRTIATLASDTKYKIILIDRDTGSNKLAYVMTVTAS